MSSRWPDRAGPGVVLAMAVAGLGLAAYSLTGRPPNPFMIRGLGLRSIGLALAGEAMFLGALWLAWRRPGRARFGSIAAATALLSSLAGLAALLRHPLSGAAEFLHRAGELAATQALLLVAGGLFAIVWAGPGAAEIAAALRDDDVAARRRLRGQAANLTLSLAAVLVGLLAAELALRLIDVGPLHTTVNDPITRGSLNRYDPVLGWVLDDNQSSGADHNFLTGAHGIRMNGREIAAPARHAIVAVGDSFTAGSAVSNWDTWPARLETLLGTRVLNAATGGWGADQIVLRAESLIPILEPREIIVSFLADDIMRTRHDIFGGGRKPYFTDANGALQAHNIPVPRPEAYSAWHDLLGRSHLAVAVMRATGTYDRWAGLSREILTNVAAVSCLLLERLKTAADAKGTALTFLLQYDGFSITAQDAEPAYATPVVACARRLDIPVVDTWETLRAVDRRGRTELERLYNMTERPGSFGHMTAAGNQLIAELVADAIRRRP